VNVFRGTPVNSLVPSPNPIHPKMISRMIPNYISSFQIFRVQQNPSLGFRRYTDTARLNNLPANYMVLSMAIRAPAPAPPYARTIGVDKSLYEEHDTLHVQQSIQTPLCTSQSGWGGVLQVAGNISAIERTTDRNCQKELRG